MVVRFEVDACLPFGTTRPHSKSNRARSATQHNEPAPAASAQGADTLSPATILRLVNKPTLRSPRLDIIRAGSRVPQSHLIELKACSRSRKHWTRSYPQLFLSQTPHIYYGTHKNGNFLEIKKFTLGEPHLEPIDQRAQVGFKKLKLVLTEIQDLVRKYGTEGRISLVCDGKELRVYQRKNEGSCLPKYALTLFKS